MCALACGKKVIDIKLNEDGFYAPIISDETKCVNCGMCVEVCSFHHNELLVKPTVISSYAAWSNDSKTRRYSSSGGVAFEIAKELLKKGYKVCGVKYNLESNRAEHYIANDIEDLIPSVGSKYLQSYTVDGFKQLNRKEKFLVVGTPCQIDSLRRLIRKRKCEDNYLLVDFFCHSVPSMLGWQYYLRTIPKEIGSIKAVTWRNKEDGGWHNSYRINVIGESGNYVSSRKEGDLFYKLFLDDLCIGPQCVGACKYKYNNSSADIRIGDLWGKLYKNDQNGVSAVIAFTEKGRQAIESLDGVTFLEQPLNIVTEGQRKTNAKANPLRNSIMKQLREKGHIGTMTMFMACYLRMISRRFRAYTNVSYIKEKLKR